VAVQNDPRRLVDGETIDVLIADSGTVGEWLELHREPLLLATGGLFNAHAQRHLSKRAAHMAANHREEFLVSIVETTERRHLVAGLAAQKSATYVSVISAVEKT
jgi:hypothetical protein